MKRLLAMLLALCMVGLCGCGGNAVEETQALESTPEATEGAQTDPVLDRAVSAGGSNHRLKKVLERMKAGEKVTVGFIGGSITEGYNARGGDNYAKLVTQYLNRTWSDGTGRVTCVNAGLSGTPSMLGLIRAERELLSAGPDLIFIEFAVNDAQTFTDRQAYEGLIRKCLLQENEPAVILLYSVTENGYTCQNDMAMTAFYYDLPAVSVRDAIMPEIESGTMTWDDWSDDDVHPHGEGHLLYSRMIAHLIETQAGRESDGEYTVPEKCRFSRDWANLTEYDRTNLNVLSMGSFTEAASHPNFRSGFSHNGGGETGNEGLIFEMTGNTLFLVFKATTSSAYGTAEVLVDGEVAAHLTACTPDGWNNPVTKLIFSDKEAAAHRIEIRMQPGDEDKRFDLLAVGIAEN